ncbi:MAG: polysaccharide biosynthesis tyrosine autokinase [Roseofilum sp. SBFL]|uniref:GumC family protein n=1 Tax=unclassified Roseofilum TaxID=2620099 RepID=UPI001B19A210|nr:MULTISPECIES: polysaccharide biosynthesis tyrosine autokinase [unclassified Roseofilum]MBP0013938.1 polysaccharide biosynthesis tyrosine autokinase [Roseofilum sp. SID3]MBP0023621.1 polysaccharide biosynthesis tyrosine autokinase [Roseofilum sp. SID2]MBP0038973.1 polysaccharide biosynthesis tyrosine autokinase [Roseofilum sp. SID1]MBP0041772.1 polysaccharide biosynthesis tyrosine autokinase [Roseofilum sp. SBFL]
MQAGTPPKSNQNGNGHNGNGHNGNGHNGYKPYPVAIPALPQASETEEFDPKQLLVIARRRWLALAGVAIAVTGAIWGWTLTRTPVYQSNFRMLVEPISEDDNSKELLRLGLGPSFDYATQIEVLRSPTLLEPLVRDMQQTYPDMTYGELVSNLTIQQAIGDQDRYTKILNISFQGDDPQKIKDILDTLLQGYSLYGIQLRQLSIQRVVQFVEEQLPVIREQVNSYQAELEAFREQHSVIDPEFRGNDISRLLTDINKQQKDSQAQLAELQSLYVVLQRQLGASPEQALAGAALSESSRYQQLLNQLLEIETEIAEESVRFQPDSPNIKALLEQRQNLLPLIDREAQRVVGDQAIPSNGGQLTPISVGLSTQLVDTTNQIQVLQVRLSALAQVENRLKEEFSIIPGLAREYTDIQLKLEVATQSLARLLETRQTLQLEAAQKSVSWEVLSEPFQPGAPISPNVPRNLVLGLFAGTLMGLGAALLAEQLDNAFHSTNDLKDLTGLPLLGIIPFKRGLKPISAPETVRAKVAAGSDHEPPPEQAPKRPLNLSLGSKGTYYNSSPFLESFRSLYTNIRFLSSDTPIRSLVISSCLPMEGKSTVSVNLARSAAAMGQRVLLVDADLRHPILHTRLGLPNLRGLSNIITSEIDPRDVIHAVEDHFYILTSGQVPPDPIKLLSSRKMQHLVEQFQTEYDLVIYDTPPSFGLADGSLLAKRSDGIMLVVALGKTGRSELNQVLDNLKMSYVSVLGIIANGVKGFGSGVDYYYRNYMPNEDQVI